MPREVPGWQREQEKGVIPVQVCDWTGCHFMASETKFSQNGLPKAYGTTVSGWSEQGKEWGDFFHCLPFPWLEALHGAWIPLHFWTENSRCQVDLVTFYTSDMAVKRRAEGPGHWHIPEVVNHTHGRSVGTWEIWWMQEWLGSTRWLKAPERGKAKCISTSAYKVSDTHPKWHWSGDLGIILWETLS